MVPDAFSAETIRPVDAEPAVRVKTPPRETRAGGFDAFLEEARSPRRGERSRRVSASVEPEQTPEKDTAGATDEGRADDRGVSAHEPEAIVPAPKPEVLQPAVGQSGEPGRELSSGNDAHQKVVTAGPFVPVEAATEEGASPAAGDPSRQRAGAEAGVAKPQSGTAETPEKKEPGATPLSRESASRGVPKEPVAPSARPPTSLLEPARPVVSPIDPTASAGASEGREETARSSHFMVRQVQRDHGVGSGNGELRSIVLQPDHGKEEGQQGVGRKMFHAARVAVPASGQRPRAPVEDAASRGEADRPRQGKMGNRATSSPRAQPAGVQHEGATDTQTASIGSARGDSAAASVARFLFAGVGGSTGPDAPVVDGPRPGSDGAVSSTVWSGFRAPTPVAAPGSGAATMMHISVSETESPEGLASAARLLSASGSSGRFQVTMQLEPPELGQMRLHIRMHEQAMVLQVDVDSPAVAKLIESRMSELRDVLAMQGIRMDRVDVVVRSQASSQAGPQQDGGQSGDGAGHPAGEQPGASTSDGGRAETAGEHGERSGDPTDGQEDKPRDDAATVENWSEDGAVEVVRTTESSLDLVA